MTRRAFFSLAAVAARGSSAPLIVPVHVLIDTSVNLPAAQIQRFWSGVWSEAVRDFGRAGIRFQVVTKDGKIWRPPNRQPVIGGLDRGVVNLVLTDQIPVEWDNGRLLSGVTTLYRGFHVCMIALNCAHGDQVPFLSLNTCVHELLHALLQDIFTYRPGGAVGQWREFRVDAYATRLWLFHDGAAVRASAQSYVARLGSEAESGNYSTLR